MTHVTCRLTAKNWDQLWNPMLGIWVWATCTFLLAKVFLNFWKHKTSLHILSSVSLSSAVKHKLSHEICIFKQDSARRTGGIEHPVMFLMNFGKMFTTFKHSSTSRSNDKFAVEILLTVALARFTICSSNRSLHPSVLFFLFTNNLPYLKCVASLPCDFFVNHSECVKFSSSRH